MGHGITAADTMYSVNKMPWHHLGKVVAEADRPRTWPEARKLSGIADWDTVTAPAFRQVFVRDNAGRVLVGPDGITPIGDVVRDYQGHVLLGADGNPLPMVEQEPGHQRHMRSDNGMTLTVQPNSWTAITHVDMGEIMEAVLPMDLVQFETGGTLDEGRRVWSLLQIGNGRQVTGDVAPDGTPNLTLPYVVLLTAHDGTASFKMLPTATRVVCGNTWHYAEVDAEASGLGYSLRHTKNWRTQVAEMRQGLVRARDEFEKTMDIAEEFAAFQVDEAQERAFFEFVVPMDEIRHGKIAQENILKQRDIMREILYSDTTRSVAHTGHGLVQCVGEWVDHVQKSWTSETRFKRSLLTRDDYKRRAANGVRKLMKGELELAA